MSEGKTIGKLGEIVESLTGRDQGNYFVVLDFDGERLILVDGDRRKFDKPKRKNSRHVRFTGFVAQEVLKAIEDTGRVSNAKLRYVLQNYLSNHKDEKNNDDDRKGDEPWPKKI